ncbi:MAG: hypothetical protein WCO69_02085 [Candidatus Omnitrophota bacterium]
MGKKPDQKVKKPKAGEQQPKVDPQQPDKETGPCCTAENVCRCSGE